MGNQPNFGLNVKNNSKTTVNRKAEITFASTNELTAQLTRTKERMRVANQQEELIQIN